jgi:hypothetical protein
MANPAETIELTLDELRAVTAFAVHCATPALVIFEGAMPDDDRPRAAIAAGWAFAQGGRRNKLIRDCAWLALSAHAQARDAGLPAAAAAARAAVVACSSAYLHPLAQATQVKHILGAAAYAAEAFELAGNPATGVTHLVTAEALAGPVVRDVLRRYPPAPTGGGRGGEIMRDLDRRLRAIS